MVHMADFTINLKVELPLIMCSIRLKEYFLLQEAQGSPLAIKR